MAKKNIMSKGGGIGESRVFAADPSEFSPNPASDIPPREQWTIGGLPIPEAIAHAVPWENTDQALALREARPHARAEITRDYSRGLERKRDFLMEHGDFEHAPDEMRRIMDENVQPGFAGRYLSPAVIGRRGYRGWEPIVQNGDPIKFGKMILAQKPQDVKNRERRAARALHTEKLDTERQNILEEQNRLLREGLPPLSDEDGLHFDQAVPSFIERGD